VADEGLRYGGGAEKFDFQALGVHLKAMEEGFEQRLASTEILADWMSKETPKIDADVLIMGDWNATFDDPCWVPFHKLDKLSLWANARVAFGDIDDRAVFRIFGPATVAINMYRELTLLQWPCRR